MHPRYPVRCLWPLAMAAAFASVGCAAGTARVPRSQPLEARWTFDDGAVRSDVSLRDLDLVVRAIERLGPADSLIVYGSATPDERASLAIARAETLRRALVARGALQDRLHVTTAGTVQRRRAQVWIEVFSEEPVVAEADLAPEPAPEPEPEAAPVASPAPAPEDPTPSLRTLPGGPVVPPPPEVDDAAIAPSDAPVWPPPAVEEEDEDRKATKRKRKRRKTRRVRKGTLVIDTSVF